jgi:hypothetical protein
MVSDTLKWRPGWDLFRSTDKEEALRWASEAGWKRNRVQVRAEWMGPSLVYIVEPFEEDCNCPQLISPPDAQDEGYIVAE